MNNTTTNRKKIYEITFAGVMIAVYVAFTYLNPIGYSIIQFRVSEILLLLPFWNKKFILPSILAVAIANSLSPLGIIDVGVGVLIALIAYFGIIHMKNHFVEAILYSIICGIFVGLELHWVYHEPIWLTMLSVGLSQLIITIAGVFLIDSMIKIPYFKKKIMDK